MKIEKISQDEMCVLLGKRVNQNVRDDIRYMDTGWASKEYYFIARIEDRIIGVQSVQDSPYAEEQVWLTGCGVLSGWRSKGVGRAVVEATLNWIAETATITAVEVSTYTEDGARKLAPIIRRWAATVPHIRVVESPLVHKVA